MQEKDVLNCWKDIAAYLGCGVRTAQRWERTLGLPVHRPSNESRQIVAAFVHELQAWRAAWGKSVRSAEFINVPADSLEIDFRSLQATIQQRIETGNTAPIVIQFAQSPETERRASRTDAGI
jgi:hypothetical protein